MYAQTNVVILGILSGSAAAGIFNGGDRIRRAAQAAIGPISTALYPRVSVLALTDPAAAFKLIRRALIAQGGLSLCVSIAIFVFADLVVNVLLGKEFGEAATILRILSPVPLLVGINNVLGTQILLPFGKAKTFSTIIIVCGLFNIVSLVALCPRLGAVGAASSIVMTEALVTGAMAIFALSVALSVKGRRIPPPQAPGA